MDYFKILPRDVTVDILSRVPGEHVQECKSVSKTWNNLISYHPSFYKMHIYYLNHLSATDSGKLSFLTLTDDEIFYYFEYDKNHDESITPVKRIRRMNFTPPFKNFKFIGSCQGLIQSVCICNPITRESLMLPEIEGDWYDIKDLEYIWMSGFCYVSSTNEYKVLRTHRVSKPWKVHMYTLGSGNGWRKVGEFDSTYNIMHLDDAGTVANEAFYWLDDNLKMMRTFDFVEEKICEPPPLPPSSNWFYSHIGVLDGFLYLIGNIDFEVAKVRELWLLKSKNDDHGMKVGDEHQALGWSQELNIDKSRLLAVAKSYGAFNLHWYHLDSNDTKASTSERLVELKERKCRVIIPHKNSLVSLKELGEQDTNKMESVEGGRDSPAQSLKHRMHTLIARAFIKRYFVKGS